MDDQIRPTELGHDAAQEAADDAGALAEIAAGKGVPSDRVLVWLRNLARGIKRPPPQTP